MIVTKEKTRFVQLGEITKALESGGRPSGGDEGLITGVPSLGGEHIGNDGGFRLNSPRLIPDSYYAQMTKGRIQPWDILIVKDGATTGKVSIVRDNFPFKRAAINEHLFLLKIDETQADPVYVFHFLFSDMGKAQILKDFRGATVGGISRGFTSLVTLPLPALKEQKRIAAILDKADAIRRQRWEAISNTRALAVSAIEFELGVLSANRLNTATLESVCNKITDGTHLTPTFHTEGIPFIFVKNIDNQRINFETSKFIDATTYDRLTKSTKIELGDVLYTTVGATYGQAALVETTNRFAFQRHLAHLKPNKNVIVPAYLAAVMNLPRIKWQADRWARGAAQPTINLTELRQMVVPVPPLDDQVRIASIRRKCDSLLEKLEIGLKMDEQLFNSLVQRAFKGEL
jgi:type I restriction enzyme S subunit